MAKQPPVVFRVQPLICAGTQPYRIQLKFPNGQVYDSGEGYPTKRIRDRVMKNLVTRLERGGRVPILPEQDISKNVTS